jgi:hypothetical protein
MLYGTIAAYGVASPTQKHFGGSTKEIPGIGEIGYIGLTAFVLNMVVTVVLTFVLKAAKAPEGIDVTSPGDYTADAGSSRREGGPHAPSRHFTCNQPRLRASSAHVYAAARTPIESRAAVTVLPNVAASAPARERRLTP